MKRILVFLLFLQITLLKAQSGQYLGFETTIDIDSYNSMGIGTRMQFQKFNETSRGYEISFQHIRHYGYLLTDHYTGIKSDRTYLNYTRLYRLNLWKNIFYWNFGYGIGLTHLAWVNNNDYKNKIGINLHLKMNLNIKLGRTFYLQTSPIPLLMPMSKLYLNYIPSLNRKKINLDTEIFQIGFKIKL
jgi:hypothetical protein